MEEKQQTAKAKRQPVRAVAAKLRERIFAQQPGEQVGSLPDLARDFGVGIVTVQQAARVLEHEGLLEVRRGPGGGYYGRRPDMASLERQLAAYMRSEPASHDEVIELTSLLFNELCAAAAKSTDAILHDQLGDLKSEIGKADDVTAIGPLEMELQNLLFQMVNRPLLELLTRVAFRLAEGTNGEIRGVFDVAEWRESRCHIIDAISLRDPELAQFEANRRNRRRVMRYVDGSATNSG